MNDAHPTVVAELPSAPREFSFLELLIVLAKNKKVILGLPLATAALAAALSLVLPEIFKASTKLLPPQQPQTSAAALLSQLGGAAGAVAGAAGLKTPNDLYIGMLKSRTVADRQIQQFQLAQAYDETSPERLRLKLERATVITAGKDGFISIEVEDRDPKLATALANGYVEQLNRLSKTLALTQAARQRMFFEQQLSLTKDNLAAAEMTLRNALETRGVISVDADSRAIVETVGRLRAQISAKEIELGSMQAVLTRENPAYKQAEQELASLRGELSKLENGRPGAAQVTGASKQLGLENIKILRDVKYHQMLYELLAKQYEVARLDEAKDSSIIQVLDVAIVPERRARPRRAVMVLFGAMLGLFLALVYAFLRESSLAGPAQASRWSTLRSHLGVVKRT